MIREHGEGAIGLLVSAVHVLDEVAAEVPVLEPDRAASLLQHPGDPGCPGTISLVEANKEIALTGRAIGHGCTLSQISPPRISHSWMCGVWPSAPSSLATRRPSRGHWRCS